MKRVLVAILIGLTAGLIQVLYWSPSPAAGHHAVRVVAGSSAPDMSWPIWVTTTTTTLPPTTTTTQPPPPVTTTTRPYVPPPAPRVVSPPSGWGCDAALAYLQLHEAPGFYSICPGDAMGRTGMTCVRSYPGCPPGNVIVIAVPCPTVYMNEASNSWVLTGQSSAAIDPYGQEC